MLFRSSSTGDAGDRDLATAAGTRAVEAPLPRPSRSFANEEDTESARMGLESYMSGDAVLVYIVAEKQEVAARLGRRECSREEGTKGADEVLMLQ